MIIERHSTAADCDYLNIVYEMILNENRKSLMAYRTKKELAQEISNGQSVLAFDDGQLLGYCSYKIWPTGIEIMSVVVHEAYRKHGLGQKLLEMTRDKVLTRHPDKMLVGLVNVNSEPLLRRLGFVPFLKSTMSRELRDSCVNCPEENKFPSCHCQTYVYPSSNIIYIAELDYSTESDMAQLIELYCETWKEPPWLEFFWTPEGVRRDILEYRNKHLGVWYVVKCGNNIVGFASGYFQSTLEIANYSGQATLAELLKNETIFYLAEIGIEPALRIQGLGQRLFETLMQFGLARGATRLLGRTKAPIMEKILRHNGFVNTQIYDRQDPSRPYWIKSNL